MMRLSDRLQRIADEIKEGETMADIGTDHGFLPAFLVESGRCPKVIMTDVSPNSLEKARHTAALHGLHTEGQEDGRIAFRVGSGLAVLRPYEVDDVVIAGMGGKLIRDIISADTGLSRSFRKYVLQPRIGQGHLRKWLTDNGFVIIREGVVSEGRHIPEIITAISPDEALEMDPAAISDADLVGRAKKNMPEFAAGMECLGGDDIQWKIPPWLVYADGPVDAFLERNIAAEEEKLENVRRARVRDMKLEQCVLHNIEYLKGLRKEYDDGKQQRSYSR